MRRAVPAPVIFTRRAFLQRTAAAGAFIAAGGAPRRLHRRRTSRPRGGRIAGTAARRTARHREIVRVAVHPAVGIGRVGNSADSFYFGPELPLTPPIAPDGFKDAAGAMARQAARFRVYGYDDQGDVVKELTAADGDDRLDRQRGQQEGGLVRLRHGDGHPGRRAGQPAQRGRHRCRPGPAGRRLGPPDDQRRRRHAVPLDAGRFLDVPVPARRVDDRRDGTAGVHAGVGAGLLARAGSLDDVLRQRRLGRRCVRRPGAGHRDVARRARRSRPIQAGSSSRRPTTGRVSWLAWSPPTTRPGWDGTRSTPAR